jgi:PmbA protein
MTAAVLTDLAPRVSFGDLTRVVDHTISVTIDEVGQATLGEDRVDVSHLRVGVEGRIGWAAGATPTVATVAEAAVRSARSGAEEYLFLPAPAPLPEVITSSDAAAALSEADLMAMARRLRSRLARPDRLVETWAERSTGLVEIGNTRGVSARYQVTVAGIGAVARMAGTGGSPARAHRAQVDRPTDAEFDAIVAELGDRLGPPLEDQESWFGRSRIWFGPRATRGLLEPVLVRLMGERWLAGRDRWPILDRRLTLVDDPLVDLRPGSRPICDDGVPTRTLTLVERGQPTAGIFDLASASRHRLPATGHGVRRGYAAPQPGFSNLRLEPGDSPPADLAAATSDGLFVPELTIGPAPDPGTGVFRVAVPWVFRIAGGEIAARVDGVTLSGDGFELLNRIVAIGSDAEWIGSARFPSVVIDGVGVTVR